MFTYIEHTFHIYNGSGCDVILKIEFEHIKNAFMLSVLLSSTEDR